MEALYRHLHVYLSSEVDLVVFIIAKGDNPFFSCKSKWNLNPLWRTNLVCNIKLIDVFDENWTRHLKPLTWIGTWATDHQHHECVALYYKTTSRHLQTFVSLQSSCKPTTHLNLKQNRWIPPRPGHQILRNKTARKLLLYVFVINSF